MSNPTTTRPNDSPAPAPDGRAPACRYTGALAGEIETRWQAWWERHHTFATPNPSSPGFDPEKPKYYVLDMFPYPSGAGLHVGHPEGYTATDIVARHMRMRGYNVLHPMGYDAFGLPAEQYAIETGIHPAITTRKAIETFGQQLRRFGFSYDWSRQFATHEPDYYRWTQWIWLRAYDAWYDPARQQARPIDDLIQDLENGHAYIGPGGELVTAGIEGRLEVLGGEPAGCRKWHELDPGDARAFIDDQRLAYLDEQTVNWCPRLGTVLANEEVIDGRSERGGHPVHRRPLRQWMFRITAYADRLLNDLDGVRWPDSTRSMQAEWIGRSEGAEIDFPLHDWVPRLSEPRSDRAPATARELLKAVHDVFDPTEQYGLRSRGFVGRDPFPPGEVIPNDLEYSHRNLPHLELSDATYFVTWRCAEGRSLPESDRRRVLDSLCHWNDERCRVYAACVMPDHVHWLVQPHPGFKLGKLVADAKRFAATAVNREHETAGSLWDPEDFDHIVRDERWFSKFVVYIAANPVRANLVNRACEYAWTFVRDDIRAPGGVRVIEFVDELLEHGSESRGTGIPALTVYTTRPDTVFGATYMVVAPEHPLVDAVLAKPPRRTDAAALRAYVDAARNRSDIDRMTQAKLKTGVFTGVHAINPANEKRIPVWVADYVLMGYGHGAIMAVPGHDQRDHDFARTFDLPISKVVANDEELIDIRDAAFEGEGVAVNSTNADVSLDDMPTAEAKLRIIDWLEETGVGTRKVNYRLRDWLFSRQRYWGEPIPIVFDADGNHYPVDEAHLPVVLPDLADYQPPESDEPTPLLAKVTDWVHTTAGAAGVRPDLLPPDTPVTREANTMPGWAGSCWYFLRFCDPANSNRIVGRDAEQYWMVGQLSELSRKERERLGEPSHTAGVDLYIGGAEHAVLHLLYARFWQKLLYDLGEVSTAEPFARLFHQGMILSNAYQRADRSLVPLDEVEQRDGSAYVERATGEPVTAIVAKMSKSLRNVVNPEDVIAEYGADTFRLYEMYMGPLEAAKPWNTRDIVGVYRFLQRAWRLAVNEESGTLILAGSRDDTVEQALHRAIAKVGADIDRLAFNTAIAAMIEFVNTATAAGGVTRKQLERFVLILSPFAPHIAEELWSRLGHDDTLAYEPWPDFDESMLQDEQIEMPVQVMGKVRGRVVVPAGATEDQIREVALADESIQRHLEGRTVRKVIIVARKIVNIVTE